MKILTNPHFLLTLTSIFWAFNTIAGRAAVGEGSPLLIVSLRWLFVSIILTFLILIFCVFRSLWIYNQHDKYIYLIFPKSLI